VNPAPPGDAPAIKPVAVPIPPDRPTLSTADFLELLAAQGVVISERSLQRHAISGDFSDRYPGWQAVKPGKSWLISPIA